MLNLVQLQERLKDVPMQALMQYANGGNPQVPPFLALGELNRRKKMQEGAAAEQAQQMEGAPSVKEQIEQATGLMALQGNRMQQAAKQQQQAQQAQPMPAPNTTTSEPAQLASGGYIEDIVVPRDFQSGGPTDGLNALRKLMLMKKLQQRRRQPGVNPMQRADFEAGGQVSPVGMGSNMDPEMLRRLMAMLKQRSGQPRTGISNLAAKEMQPMNQMAGGGIVAFNGEKGSEVSAIGKDPYDEDNKSEFERDLENWIRAQKESMQERTPGMVGAYKKPLISRDEEEAMRLRQILEQKYGPKASMLQGYFSRMPQSERAAAQDIYKRIPGMSLAELRQMAGVRGAAPETVEAQASGRPDENYSNEGRAYARGALNPVTESPMASRKPSTGIENLLNTMGDSGAKTVATPNTTPDIEFLRRMYNKPPLDVEAELKRRGLDVLPQAGKTIEELQRQREEIKGEDTLANRILALTPGRRFGSGETGRGLLAYEKAQADKLRQIGLDISKAEDLRTQAEFAHKMGNFKLEQELRDKADDNARDAAKSAGQLGVSLEQVAAQRENTAAQRERNLLDRTQADKTRQMGEINEYISNFRAKNANNTKYFNKPDLLFQDAISEAIKFFGPERFKNLGLAPGFGAAPATPSGARPPLSSFQR